MVSKAQEPRFSSLTPTVAVTMIDLISKLDVPHLYHAPTAVTPIETFDFCPKQTMAKVESKTRASKTHANFIAFSRRDNVSHRAPLRPLPVSRSPP